MTLCFVLLLFSLRLVDARSRAPPANIDEDLQCCLGRDLLNMCKKRPNFVPIIEDARHPAKYRMLVPMVDVIFADVAQPDQARIVGFNAQGFLKNGGNYVISIKMGGE